MKKFILLPWKSISTQEAGGQGWKAYFSYCNNIQFFMFPNNFFCIWAMVLLITGLPVVSKVGKLGGQSRCRVKQKTTDLQFLWGLHSHVCFQIRRKYAKFLETCYREKSQFLVGTASYRGTTELVDNELGLGGGMLSDSFIFANERVVVNWNTT